MKLHLYAEEITPEYLEEVREIARMIFGKNKCEIVIHDGLGKPIYGEVLTNEKETEKAEESEKAEETK
jgi:hypothetical protein